MSTHQLVTTERKLSAIFVVGIFLFLITFEGAFLLARNFQENDRQKTDFEREISRIADRPVDTQWSGRPPFPTTRSQNNDHQTIRDRASVGVGFIVIDKRGDLLVNRLGGAGDVLTTEDVLDRNELLNLPLWVTVFSNGLLLRSVPVATGSGQQMKIFVGKGGYLQDDMLRDILRFLVMDFVILLPFWFVIGFFIRKTLDPVQKNMEAMTHFINDAGHELKTPLAVISGNMQLLRDMKQMDRTLVDESIETVHSMSDSLNGLLELSQITKPEQIEIFSIWPCIEEIIRMRQPKIDARNLSVHLEIPSGATIRMSRQHFVILASNLIENAIRYNKDGGTLTIKQTKNTLIFADTGIGMSEENTAKIFDRFFRVDRSGKYAGTGIGLAIVDHIIKLYGWMIKVESTLGGWTKFILSMK